MSPLPSLPALSVDNGSIVNWVSAFASMPSNTKLTLKQEFSSLVDNVDQSIGHGADHLLRSFHREFLCHFARW